MINLIPNEEKKKMIKDFYFRLIVVFVFVLGFAVLVSCFAIVPSYLFSVVKKQTSEEKLLIQKNLPEQKFDKDGLSLMDDLNTKLSIVENVKDHEFLISRRVIDEIIQKKTPGIRINRFSFHGDFNSGYFISISGSASSREALLSFRRSLETDSNFTKVDLPISNFIKGTDIKFEIHLTTS